MPRAPAPLGQRIRARLRVLDSVGDPRFVAAAWDLATPVLNPGRA